MSINFGIDLLKKNKQNTVKMWQKLLLNEAQNNSHLQNKSGGWDPKRIWL